MKEKFNYLKSYNASSRSLKCSALFNNIAKQSTWTGFSSNDIFEHNYFLYKQHIVRNASWIQQNVPTVKTWYLCSMQMIFATGYCWYVKPAIQGLTKYSAIHYDQPNIDSFLTSLFVGRELQYILAYSCLPIKYKLVHSAIKVPSQVSSVEPYFM